MLEDQQGSDLLPGTVERKGDCGTSNIDAAALSAGTSNTQGWMERFSRNFKLNDHQQPCTRRKAPCRKPLLLPESVPTQSKFGDEVVSKVLLLTRWRTRARQRADSKRYSMASRRPLLAHFREITERSGCVLGAAMEHDGIEPHVRMKLQLSHAEEDERIAHAAEEHLKDFTPMEVIRERVKRAMSGVQLWTAGSSRIIDPDVLSSVDTDDEESLLGLPHFPTSSNDGSDQQRDVTSRRRRSPPTRSRRLAAGARSSGIMTINGELQPQTPDPWHVDEDDEGSQMLRAVSDPGDASVRVSYAGSVLVGATSDDEVVRHTNDGVVWPDDDDGIDVAPPQAGGGGGGGGAAVAVVPSPPLSTQAAAVATVRRSARAAASVNRVARGGLRAGAVGVDGAGEIEGRAAADGGPTVAAAALTSGVALNAGGTLAAVLERGPSHGTVNVAAAAAEATAVETAVAAATAAVPEMSSARPVARLASPTAGLVAPGADEAAATDPRIDSGRQGNPPGVAHSLRSTLQLVIPYQQEVRVLDPEPAEPAPALPVQPHDSGCAVDTAQPRQDAMATSEQRQGEDLPSGGTALVPEPGPSSIQMGPAGSSLLLPILHDVSPGLGAVDACTVAATFLQPSFISGGTTRTAPASSSVVLTKQVRGKRGAAAAAAAGRGAAKPLAPRTVAVQGQGQGQGHGSSLATGRRLAVERQSVSSRSIVWGGRVLSGRTVVLAAGEGSNSGEPSVTARAAPAAVAAPPQPSASLAMVGGRIVVLEGAGLNSGEPSATARAAAAAVAQPPQPSASLARVDLAAFFDRPKGRAPVRQKLGPTGGIHPPKRVHAHAVSEHARGAGGGTGLGLGATAAPHPPPSPPQQLVPRPASPLGVVPDKPVRSSRAAAIGDAQPHCAAKESDASDASSGGDLQGHGGPCRTSADGQSPMPHQSGPQPEQPLWSLDCTGPRPDGLKGCDTVSPALPSYSPAEGLPRLQAPAGGDPHSGEWAPRVSPTALETLSHTSPRWSQPGFLPYFDTSPSGAPASTSGEVGNLRIMTLVQQQQPQPLPAVGHSPNLQQMYGKPVAVSAVLGPAGQSPGGPAAAAFTRRTGWTSPMRLPRAAPDSPSLLHKDSPPLQVQQQQPQSMQQQPVFPAGPEQGQGQGQGEQPWPSSVWASGRIMPAMVSPTSLSRLATAAQDDLFVNAARQPALSSNLNLQRSAVSLSTMSHGSHPHPLSQPQPQLPRQQLAPLRPSGKTQSAPFVAAAAADELVNAGGGGSISVGGAAPMLMPSLPSPGPGRRNSYRLASESLGALLDLGSPSTNRLAPVVPPQRAVGANNGGLASSKAFLPELRPSVVARDFQAAATRGSAGGAAGRSPMLDGPSAADPRMAMALEVASQSLSGEDFSTATATTRLPDLIVPAFLSSGGAAPPPLPSGLVRGLTGPLAQHASSHRSRLAAAP